MFVGAKFEITGQKNNLKLIQLHLAGYANCFWTLAPKIVVKPTNLDKFSTLGTDHDGVLVFKESGVFFKESGVFCFTFWQHWNT